MSIVRVPDHRFFLNGDDGNRLRDARVVAWLCALLDLTSDEAIELLTKAGRVELARQDARWRNGRSRWLLTLARAHGVEPNLDERE